MNREFVSRVEVLDKMWMGWWQETHSSRKWRRCLQWACGCGTGYMVPRWDENFHGPGLGDVSIDIFGTRDILPIQLPRDHDLQKAYAVLIRKRNAARSGENARTWPEFADQIVADRDAPCRLPKSRLKDRALLRSAILNRFAGWQHHPRG